MKTVLITGANGNLGTAVTSEFLNKGYQVIATVAGEAMQKDLAAHERLDTRVVNLMEEEETAALITDLVKSYKKIDAAVMLVGGFAMGDIASTTGSDIKKQISLNFDTAYFVARPLFAHMTETGAGRLLFIGARPAISAAHGKDLIAYSLSKSLLFKLAEFLNETAKGTDVTATVIAPSTLDTPLNRKSMPDTDPNSWVKPAALAEVLEFVVSEKGSILRETVLKTYNNS